jgi:hypothetical protein
LGAVDKHRLLERCTYCCSCCVRDIWRWKETCRRSTEDRSDDRIMMLESF